MMKVSFSIAFVMGSKNRCNVSAGSPHTQYKMVLFPVTHLNTKADIEAHMLCLGS